jgi:hypothetical protein
MSKESIKQAADALFASTAYNVLWSNLKGEFFTSENTGSLSLKKGEKLTKHERSEAVVAKEKKEVVVLNPLETISKIQGVTSLEALKEFEADKRKTVIAAYEDKRAELTAAITVVGATNEGTTPTTGNGNSDTEGQK